jgi:predicted nucleotidyltransferase
MKQLSKMLGMPDLNTDYLPIRVVLELQEQASKMKDLGALVLFGSIVRGEASPKSDIDIMAIPMAKEVVETLEIEVRQMLSEVERIFNLKASFSLLMFKGDEDSHFLWEVIKDGGVIYCDPSMLIRDISDISPKALISYTYADLNNTNKKRLQRFLFTSKDGINVNKKKLIEYVSPGVLLLDIQRAEKFRRYLDELDVKYSYIKIWS